MKRFVSAVLALGAGASMALGTGTVIPVNVSNIPSHDGYDLAGNTVGTLNVALALGLPNGTACTMNGIGWDVNLFADPAVGPFGGSWLQELAADFDNSAHNSADEFFLTPGAGNTNSGVGHFISDANGDGIVDILKLRDPTVGLNDLQLPDGVLRVQFFETFDDAVGVDDGQWRTLSILYIQATPEPASFGLLALGALALLRRR